MHRKSIDASSNKTIYSSTSTLNNIHNNNNNTTTNLIKENANSCFANFENSSSSSTSLEKSGQKRRLDRRKSSILSQFKFKLQESIKNLGENQPPNDDDEYDDFNKNNDDNSYSSTCSEPSNEPQTSMQHSSSSSKPSSLRNTKYGPNKIEKQILKQTYYNLLCALLDPNARLNQPHNFQLKTFTKITTCDECHSVLWGIHKQGLQCTKCNMCLHEKCLELIQIGCIKSKLANRTNSNPINNHPNSSPSVIAAGLSSAATSFSVSLGSSSSSSSSAKELIPATPQAALDNRVNDVKEVHPCLLSTIEKLFVQNQISLNNTIHSLDYDIRQVQQDYLNKSVKKIKTKLKIFVKNAIGLIAKDSCGTSDPYVTIQCGFSQIKRTKTQKKKLNPIWNETLEFEYFNTSDGIYNEKPHHHSSKHRPSHDSNSNNPNLCGNKIIIRVWDEDVGIKAQLDKMLTKESDDFLGQIVLDINDLNLNGEQPYELKPRNDGSPVTGYIILSISLSLYEVHTNLSRINETSDNQSCTSNQSSSNKKDKSPSSSSQTSYLDQYRALHKFLFKHIANTSSNTTSSSSSSSSLTHKKWLLECIPVLENAELAATKSPTYFKNTNYDLILKKFSNKYVISEIQKQMVHLECLYSYFIDRHLLKMALVHELGLHHDGKILNSSSHNLNCKILSYMCSLLSLISSAYSINKIQSNVPSTPSDNLSESTSITLSRRHNSESNKNLSALFKQDILIAPKNFQSNLNIKLNKKFLHQTCILPNKLILLLSNYRTSYPVKHKINNKSGKVELVVLDQSKDQNEGVDAEKEEVETQKNVLDEMQETLNLFKTSCLFIHKHLKLKTFKTNFSDRECASLFNINKLRTKYASHSIVLDRIQMTDYNLNNQYDIVKKLIELALNNHFNRLMIENNEDSTFSLVNLDSLSGILQQRQNRSSSSSLSSLTNKGKYTFNEDGSIIEIDSASASGGGLSNINNQKAAKSNQNQNNNLSYLSPALLLDPVYTTNFHYIMNKIDILTRLLSKNVLNLEIELNTTLYIKPFLSTYEQNFEKESDQNFFRNTIIRILTRKYLITLIQTIHSDREFISKLRLEHVKQHLNLFLFIKSFLSEFSLDKLSLKDLMQFSFFESNNNGSKFDPLLEEEEKEPIDNLMRKRMSSTTAGQLEVDVGGDLIFMHATNFKNLNSLNELFQPFLIEFIHEQEDQFIKYIYKIYDNDKLNRLAKDVAHSINENRLHTIYIKYKNSINNNKIDSIKSSPTTGPFQKNNNKSKRGSSMIRSLNDLENYHSPSVTDLFTILHELLQTILLFDTDNSDLNLPQQMCFVNLIKSKLLTYSCHIKKQYNKIYRAGSINYNTVNSKTLLNSLSLMTGMAATQNTNHFIDDTSGGLNFSFVQPTNELTITSCILMNNFKKTIELLDEIQLKLTTKSELKQVVIDQLESIKVILKEDLDNMIEEYANEYQKPFAKICEYIQIKIFNTFKMRNVVSVIDSQANTSSSNTSNGPGSGSGGGQIDLNMSLNLITNLIDETLYNMLNEKFMICKIVLFDAIFKQLLEEIFKILMHCVEEYIVLYKRGGGSGGASGAAGNGTDDMEKNSNMHSEKLNRTLLLASANNSIDNDDNDSRVHEPVSKSNRIGPTTANTASNYRNGYGSGFADKLGFFSQIGKLFYSGSSDRNGKFCHICFHSSSHSTAKRFFFSRIKKSYALNFG